MAASLPISVCILTHDNRDTLLDCVRAVKDHSSVAEILILDNGSRRAVSWSDEITRTIRSDKNIGVIRGRNRLAREANCDWLLFLDDDQFVGPESISKLFRTAAAGGAEIAGATLCITNTGGVGSETAELSYDNRTYLGAGGLLVKKDVFLSLGGFDEAFGMAYCEDADFSWRARAAGFNWLWCPDAGILHKTHSTLPLQRSFDNDLQHAMSHALLCSRWKDRLLGPGFGFPGIHQIPGGPLGSLHGSDNSSPAAARRKPRILFISDRPDWAIARNVDAVHRLLSHKFDISRSFFARPSTVPDPRGYHDVRDLDFSRYDLVIPRTIIHLPPDVYSRLSLIDPRKVAITIEAFHCYDDTRFTGVFKDRLACAAHIFCVSDGIYRRSKDFFSGRPHKVFYTPQGIETHDFFNQRTIRNAAFTAGWAGNAHHGHPVDHKRFYEIILPVIEELHGEVNFRLAARDVEPAILKLLNNIGVAVSPLPFNEMTGFYNSVDLYLNASRSEAVASTTCEAVACGTPVVTTPVGHAHNIIVNGLNGRIVAPDVDEFVSAIREFKEKDYKKVFGFNRFMAEKILNWERLIYFTDRALEAALETAS